MALKLFFKISKITDLKRDLIIERMKIVLAEKEYRIIDAFDSNLKFNTNPWMPRWNFEPMQLDGGEFEIIAKREDTVLELSYYVNFLPRLIMFGVLIIILSSNKEYDGVIFFISAYFIFSIIDLIVSRIKAKQLIKEVLIWPIEP